MRRGFGPYCTWTNLSGLGDLGNSLLNANIGGAAPRYHNDEPVARATVGVGAIHRAINPEFYNEEDDGEWITDEDAEDIVRKILHATATTVGSLLPTVKWYWTSSESAQAIASSWPHGPREFSTARGGRRYQRIWMDTRILVPSFPTHGSSS